MTIVEKIVELKLSTRGQRLESTASEMQLLYDQMRELGYAKKQGYRIRDFNPSEIVVARPVHRSNTDR